MDIISRVAIVIVNWNRKDELLRCISSITLSTYDQYEILVVDNGSTDGSIEDVKKSFTAVHLIENGKNLGFTGGNNLGIGWAQKHCFEWVLLLNNDVVIAPDGLEKMLEYGQQHKQVGIVGPTVYHADRQDVIQSAGGLIDKYWNFFHRGQNQLDIGQYSEISPVNWVTGCAMLVRVDMIKHIGLLDERFFAYDEEVDWCIRASHAGWQIVHVPASHIWHSGVSQNYQPEPYVTYYMTRNQLLILSKYRANIAVWLAVLARQVKTLISWTVYPKWTSKIDHRNALLRGMIDFMRCNWGPMPR